MPLETFLRSHGLNYTIQRCGETDRLELGLTNHEKATGRAYIGFRPNTDIKVDDILINPSGDRVFVVDVMTDFFCGKPEQLKAYYQTEAERNIANRSTAPIFNVQNAYNSVIGTGNQVTFNYDASIQELKRQISEFESPDKAEMEKIVALLEMVVNNQVPPSKGLFSKFSAVMERHSWLSSSVAATVLGWLLSQLS